jgi:hypothetical protein
MDSCNKINRARKIVWKNKGTIIIVSLYRNHCREGRTRFDFKFISSNAAGLCTTIFHWENDRFAGSYEVGVAFHRLTIDLEAIIIIGSF